MKNLEVNKKALLKTRKFYIGRSFKLKNALIAPVIVSSPLESTPLLVLTHTIQLKTLNRYNICQNDVGSTQTICQAMLDEVFKEGLTQPTSDFLQMSRALLEGVWAIVPFINPEAYLAFTKALCGIDNVQLTTFYSKTLFHVQIFVHSVILNSLFSFVIRPILNFNMWLSLFITQRFPYLAYLAFGRNISPPPQFTIQSPQVTDS